MVAELVWPEVPASVHADHVRALLSEIKRVALASQDISQLLALGQLYGRLLWVNPVGIYRDDAFEEVLLPLANAGIEPSRQTLSERILHVISTPYNAGGHTRLMERLYGFESECSDVLITRPFRDVNAALRLPSDAVVHYHEHGYDLAGLVDVVSAYRFVCLHIHPDDLQAAVAVGIAKRRVGSRVIFVNHADHVFSFGFHCADVVAEISTFGHALSKLKREVSSCFLGIALDSLDFLPVPVPDGSRRHIVSAAAPHKFKPANGYSFPDIAMMLLRAIPDSTLTVIGPKPSNRWWWMARLLFPRRLRLYPVLPYGRYLALMQHADVYLDSLPMTGGTALPEIRAQGIAVTGLWTGALGYTPFDQTKFTSRETLLAGLGCFLAGAGGHIADVNNMPSVLAQARKVHAPDEVGSRFRQIIWGDELSMADMQVADHDQGFYERLWQEERAFNLDRSARRQLLKLIGAGHSALLWPLLRATVGWQSVRILLASLGLILSRRR